MCIHIYSQRSQKFPLRADTVREISISIIYIAVILGGHCVKSAEICDMYIIYYGS